MDLRNNLVTVSELIANAEAKKLLKREFPEVMNPVMLQLAKKMTLESVLNLARDRYPAEKLQNVLSALKAL